MTPANAIAKLDAQLAVHGQTITLRRSGSPNVDVSLLAFVRGYEPRELNGGVVQGDSEVTISPTGIGSWPGALAQSDGTDTKVPRKNDKVVIAGRVRNIEAPMPIYIGSTLVRVNLQVRG